MADLGSLVENGREEADIDLIGDSVVVWYTILENHGEISGATFIIFLWP